MSTPSARPPILRFLILFCGLVAGALALAALSPAAATADAPAPVADGQQAAGPR